MKILSKHWYADFPIDFEQKKYILLDFLQSIEEDFKQKFLYPAFTEITSHSAILSEYKHSRDEMMKKMKTLTGVDLIKMKLLYEAPFVNKDFEEISSIVEFSIPQVKFWANKGYSILEKISNESKWEAVGIVPEYKEEGYVIIHVGDKDLYVYRFKIEHMHKNNDVYVGITTDFIDSIQTRLKNYEEIKMMLVKKYSDLPVPMTVSVQFPEYPFNETILPLVKRTIVKKIRSSL